MNALRLVFMGTPDFSVPVLSALIDAGHEVVCVYSQPPRPSGRGMAERKSPVHLLSEEYGIEVRTPVSLKTEDEQDRFAALNADAAVVVAYGLILPSAILEAPRYGCFNVHASLLPRWRGAAPIQRAIMAGDQESGVCIMQMDEGLDTGAVCLERKLPIGANMIASDLHGALSELGATAMTEALQQLDSGALRCDDQAMQGVTYAAKIEKSESRIDFSQSSESIHNHIRGLSPFPGAWFELSGKQKLRIKVLNSELASGHGQPGTTIDNQLTIACGNGAIKLLTVQRSGKSVMDVPEFLRGNSVPAGTDLS